MMAIGVASRGRRSIVWLLVPLLLALAGCGKKGAPGPPGPPEQVTYPRVYPTY